MGVISSRSTDGKTPVCDCCGIHLCWDIAPHEYEEAKPFWDAWKCQDCNGGKPMSLAHYRDESIKKII